MSRKAVKAAIGYTIGNYLVKGLVFLTIPIFSRLLSTADYGIYNTYLAYESIISLFISLALFTSLKNAKYDFKNEYNAYVSSILVLQIVSFLAAISIVFVTSGLSSKVTGMNMLVMILLLIQSLGSGVLSTYNVHVGLSYSYKKYVEIAAFNSVLNISASLLLIMTVFDEERSFGRILGTVIPYFFIIPYVWQYFFKQARPSISHKYWTYGLLFSLPLIPHAISQVILSQFDRIMIANMVGSSEAGIYSFAYNILSIILVIYSSLDNVWSPWFYEKMYNGALREIREKSAEYAIGMLIICLIIMLIAPEMIKILGPKEYWDSVYCVIPLVMGGYFTFLYTIPCQVEYFHKKTAMIAVGTLAAALINIITNYIFIKMYGYIAAAYTTLFTYILYFIFHYQLAKHIEKKQIFATRIFMLSSLILFVVGLMSIITVDLFIIRYLVLMVILVISYQWEKKHLGISFNTVQKYFKR